MIPGDYHGTDSGAATEILSRHTRMHEQAKQQYDTRLFVMPPQCWLPPGQLAHSLGTRQMC